MRAPLRSISFRLLSVAGLLALAGCFGDPDPPAEVEAVAPPPVAARPPDAPSEATPPAPATDRPASKVRLPNDGLVIRELDDGLLLFAKGVNRFKVLQALAVRYRFEVVDPPCQIVDTRHRIACFRAEPMRRWLALASRVGPAGAIH